MKRTYDEIMDKIEVTEEMRERLLNNLQIVECKKPAKVVHISSLTRYVSIAACFALLIIGAITLPKIINIGQPDLDNSLQNSSTDIVELSSTKELSATVGFDIKDFENLPFDADKKIYTSYRKELAEIEYISDSQTITFRKSIGDEDNSGDYTNYESVVETKIGMNTVTLKGTGEKYNLAVWTDKEFSYSIHFTTAISKDELQQMILGIN